MKRLLQKNLLMVIALILCSSFYSDLHASHIPGANITYSCNPSNPLEYTFTLTLFRKCPGTHPATMPTSNFTLTNDCGLTSPVVPTFNQVGVAEDVNQLCSSITSNCSGGTQPGVWKYTYEATIILPAHCNGWTIAYDLCCRDASSNLSGTSSNNMAMSTTLNTLNSPCNNSPVVVSDPIPYACINTNFNYCLQTYDPEGDSMTFQMIAPAGAAQAPITHLAGFTPALPLNNFTLDPMTGCISLNHPTTGNYVVAIMIREWDSNGLLLSEIVHDFQIMVINCTNTPPTNPSGGISNFTGTASQSGPANIAICYGNSACFDVVFEDAVDLSNNLTIITDGLTLLPGATFTQTGTNPVTGTFCWTAQPGYLNDVVTFIAEDDGCPVMGTTGFAVDFDIVPGVYAGADVTICGTQSAQLQATNSTAFTWTPSTGLSCTNCSNPVATPAVTTTYTVTGNLAGACSNVDQVTVNVVPDFPLNMVPASATVCANEVVQLNANGGAAAAPYTYNWSPTGTLNDPAISNPLAQPLTTTNYNVTVTSAAGCVKTDNVPVTVSGIGPTVTIDPADTNICAGQPVVLTSNATIYPISCGPSSGCTGTNGSGTVGTGINSTSTYSPFYGSSVTANYTSKTQYIFTVAELNALGFYGGTLESITLELVSSLAGKFDAQIYLGCTNLTEYANTSFIPTASLTQVHAVGKYDASIGFHTFNFNITDYDWDGTSSLVVQFCTAEFQTNGTSNIRYGTSTPAYRFMYDYTSTTTSCNELIGSRTTNRPNLGFGFCQQAVTAPTYNWIPATNLSSSTAPNPTATPTTTTAYVLNVTDGASGCTGSGIATVNVGADFNLTVSASSTNICYGATANLLATPIGAGGPYTYTWSPATSLSNASIANPVATPSSTTTYFVTVTGAGGTCEKYGSVTINVSGNPVSASASLDNICPGTPVVLDVVALPQVCGSNPGGCSGTTNTQTIGTGTASTSTYSPWYGGYSDTKAQYLYTAADLTAMGLTAGTITEIGFNVITHSSTAPYNNFSLSIGCTNSTVLSTATGWEAVSNAYGPTSYTPTLGWNMITLTTPYDWDGVSNLVVEACYDNAAAIGYDYCQYTCPGYVSTMKYYTNNIGSGCSLAPTYTYTCRPNIRFTMCQANLPAGATFLWAPAADLNDATLQSPTATPLITTNYNVSVTDPGNPGCPSIGNVTVNVQDIQVDITPAGPVGICTGDPAVALSAQLMVNGAPAAGGAGANCYDQTINYTNPALLAGSNSFNFPGTPTGSTGGTLTVRAYGDLDGVATGTNAELWTIRDEGGATLGTCGGSATQCGTTHTTVIPLTALQINTWAANGSIDFTGVDVSGFINTTLCAVGADMLELRLEYDCSVGSGYTWSPSAGLSDPAIQNPTANPASSTTYQVEATYGACTVTNTIDVNVGTPSTTPTLTGMPGTYCPNTTLTLNAGGGTAGVGSSIEWYTGANGTGTWLGSGPSLSITPTTTGQTYYIRREGGCNITGDDMVTINLKDYVYGLTGATTNTYCTDNAGWHHFFSGNEILLSLQGDLSGMPAGAPTITIMDNGAFYQQTQGPSTAPLCASTNLTPGEERFEMERNWNVNIGAGTLLGTYDVRFYYEPAERTAIETAAANWMATYPACGYTYKYPNPLGFYWFKNVGSDYTAPDYDGLHLGAAAGTTPNGVNYGELAGITSFSGGSGAIILVPSILLPVQWLYFDGETIDNKVNNLRWATESEQNSDHFNIQRSKDGVSFENIGSHAAQGNTTVTTHYTFDDQNPFEGPNYYRLELVDADGNTTYSSTILLVIASDGLGYNFYPNPTNDVVFYQYEAKQKENLKIEVLDVLGKQVISKDVLSVVGTNNIPVDLTTFPAGTYMVRVHNQQSSAVHTVKVIKNKF